MLDPYMHSYSLPVHRYLCIFVWRDLRNLSWSSPWFGREWEWTTRAYLREGMTHVHIPLYTHLWVLVNHLIICFCVWRPNHPLRTLDVDMYISVSSYKNPWCYPCLHMFVCINHFISEFVLVCVYILMCEHIRYIRVRMYTYIPSYSIFTLHLNSNISIVLILQ